MAASDAKPYPIVATSYRVTFPIYDADGDLVSGAAGLDSEISKDGGTFADCTNEAVEIATNSGMYYLDLSSSEMNAATVVIIVKTSTSGAKTTPIVILTQTNADTAMWASDFLKIDMANITSEAARSPINALRLLRNKVTVTGGTMTVTKENDSTSAWTAAVTSTPGADPITAIDPA